jgi:hypothetical protein
MGTSGARISQNKSFRKLPKAGVLLPASKVSRICADIRSEVLVQEFPVRLTLNIFETIGLAYTILATSIFTIELIYCAAKGLNALRHLLHRGQGGDEKRKGELTKRQIIKLQS